MQVRKQQFELDVEQQTGSKSGKELCQGCILSPYLFNFYAEYITWNAGLDEAQTGIKIAGRNINNLRNPDDTTLMAESEEELKSLLMKVKEESEKVGLNLSVQKTKTMASGPITSWQIDGETMEAVRDFIILGCKITADGDCSLEIKTLAPWKKSYDKPKQHIKKQRHYFANKGPSKAMVFPVVIYGCEIWTVKKANLEKEMATHASILAWKSPWTEEPGRLQSMGLHDLACVHEGGGRWVGSNKVVELKKLKKAKRWKIDTFWTVVLEKTLESPLDCKEFQPVNPKGNQSWIFVGRTDAEAETPILWPPDARNWLIWKDPDAGKNWRREEKGMTEDEMVGWHHRLNGHEF